MRIVALAALVLVSAGMGTAHARPIILEESAVIAPPPGSTYVRFGMQVGTSGDYSLVLAERPTTGDDNQIQPFDALLYRRVNGSWVFQRILAQGQRNFYDGYYYPVIVGMKGALASTTLGDLQTRIFEFNGADWVVAGSGASLHEDVALDGQRVLYGIGEYWNGRVYERAANGTWTGTTLPGQPRCCDDEFWGGPVDLLGNRAILGTPDTWDLEPQEIPIYQNYSGTWSLMTKLQVPDSTHWLGAEVALHANNAIVNGLRSGAFIWTDGNFYGQPQQRLQAVNAYARGASTYSFAKDGELLLASAFDPDLNGLVINVFRRDADNRYEHVAILKPRAGVTLGGGIEIDGNTVIASSTMRALVFELPDALSAPQPRYEHFETGNGANWTPSAGAQFTVVRPTAVNGVYRQASIVGDAHSVLGNSSFPNQGVEADVRPAAFGCADCWVGVATRYSNPQNYYYVTLRNSQTVQLRRMRNGVFTTLASAPLAVQANRTYRVRLDSIGGQHRVYVDGRLLLTAVDTGPVVAGNAALVMYRAQADYDNVAASPTPRGTIFADDFAAPDTYVGDWSHTGTGQWAHANGAYAQSSIAGDARALIGAPTDDQIVSLRVRPTAFAAATGSQERWVGVLARHTNDQNYYYLSLRSGNTVSLRKLVNGAITTIASAPASVSVGSWYGLRLEVTGNTLRGYLNDSLVIQATDSSHASGRMGPVTYKAAAEFDDFVAYQP